MSISTILPCLVSVTVCLCCWGGESPRRPVLIDGLTDDVSVEVGIDAATLRQEVPDGRFQLTIGLDGDGRVFSSTVPAELSPLARAVVDRFIARVTMPAARSAAVGIDLDLAALAKAAEETPSSVAAAPVTEIELRRAVGVLWPLTTRSKFLAKAKVRVSVDSDGAVRTAELVEATAPEYGLNALAGAYMCSFSMPSGFARSERASVLLSFQNEFSDSGKESAITQIEWETAERP